MKFLNKKQIVGVFTGVVFVLAATLLPVVPVNAQVQNGVNAAKGADVPEAGIFGSDSIFTTVVNFLLFFIGAISVIMLIWGGIRYATSGGASASVTSAKNTILYAVIGLVVAFLAYAIVNWVLKAVQGQGTA